MISRKKEGRWLMVLAFVPLMIVIAAAVTIVHFVVKLW